MSALNEVVLALWHQDFAVLADPQRMWIVYAVMFTLLFLENGLLPAAFLPGDSVLLLAGALIARGVMNFIPALMILTIAASLGCWMGYLQGRWLGNSPLVQGWLKYLPTRYHQRAGEMFMKHGLAALLIGRFLAFVRTLLPTMAGISGLSNTRFQVFNWLSGLLWVVILVTLGYGISHVPLIRRHEDQVMTALMLIPLLLLISGLIGSLILVLKKRYHNAG